jgi:hypothetical protein
MGRGQVGGTGCIKLSVQVKEGRYERTSLGEAGVGGGEKGVGGGDTGASVGCERGRLRGMTWMNSGLLGYIRVWRKRGLYGCAQPGSFCGGRGRKKPFFEEEEITSLLLSETSSPCSGNGLGLKDGKALAVLLGHFKAPPLPLPTLRLRCMEGRQV